MVLPNRRVLEAEYETRRCAYEEVLQHISQRLNPVLREMGLHPTIKVRVKSFRSFFEKFIKKLRQGFTPETAQITDILGLRIVCPFMEDIRKAENLVRDWFILLEEDHKGSSQGINQFGYETVHFLAALPAEFAASLPEDCPPIPIEIQVRTILQDAWAEVEHELIYKAKFAPFDQPLKRKLAALNANLTLSDIIFQEIRDYQRQLSRELDTRRKIFIERVKDKVVVDHSPHEDTNGSGFSDIDQLLLDGLSAHNRRQYKKAINFYSSILKLNPSSYVRSLVLVHRGMAYFSEDLYEDALDDFEHALRDDPKNSKAYLYRGIVHNALEEFPRALDDLTRSLELTPYQFDALLARSRTWSHMGKVKEAREDCFQALALHPEDPDALVQMEFLEVQEKEHVTSTRK